MLMPFFYDHSFVSKFYIAWIFILLWCVKCLQVDFFLLCFCSKQRAAVFIVTGMAILDTFLTPRVLIIWKNNWTGAKIYINTYTNTCEHSYTALEFTVCSLDFSQLIKLFYRYPLRVYCVQGNEGTGKTNLELHGAHRLVGKKGRKFGDNRIM